jgi:hypothetical protein
MEGCFGSPQSPLCREGGTRADITESRARKHGTDCIAHVPNPGIFFANRTILTLQIPIHQILRDLSGRANPVTSPKRGIQGYPGFELETRDPVTSLLLKWPIVCSTGWKCIRSRFLGYFRSANHGEVPRFPAATFCHVLPRSEIPASRNCPPLHLHQS